MRRDATDTRTGVASCPLRRRAATAAASTDPAPEWALDLRGQLECTAAPAPGGYERGSAPPVGHEGTASPYSWLYSIDDPDLPLDGYVIEPMHAWEDGLSHFTRHVYRAGGAIKAVLLMEGTSTQGGPGSWDVTAWSACQPEEFKPADGRTTDDAPWLDAAGRATKRAHTIAGPGHCGWQSTVWLRRRGNLYLRDPEGVLASAGRASVRGAAVATEVRGRHWPPLDSLAAVRDPEPRRRVDGAT